jgi:PRD1 phage membrane DNA delivery
MNEALTLIGTTAAAVIGLAIVAVLVSKNAQTGSVISSAGTAFSSVIGAAVSPVSGSSTGSISNGGLGISNTDIANVTAGLGGL